MRTSRSRFLLLRLRSSFGSPFSVVIHLTFMLEFLVNLPKRILIWIVIISTLARQLTLKFCIIGISGEVLELARVSSLLGPLTSAAHSTPFVRHGCSQAAQNTPINSPLSKTTPFRASSHAFMRYFGKGVVKGSQEGGTIA
jgi:hypothetical protein